jgi:hypothetical protein
MRNINPFGVGRGHAQVERGFDSSPRSRLFAGRFGRMFRSLPPADFEDAALLKLAAAMVAAPETNDDGQLEVTPETEVDDEENYGLPAGYTYFGQFIDHDISFDPLSSLVKLNDPNGLTDFRTPALDLDGLYGRGPDDQPYMYTPNGRKFLLGDRTLTGALDDRGPIRQLTFDLPRFHGRAIIGDKRNDENVIVSQLHGLFLRFHNMLADRYPELSFAEIQQLVRWHYQWLVLFDFLPRIIGCKLVESILPHIVDNSNIYTTPPRLHFFSYRDKPFMPVEFSGAAYRFGHSMVRPVYRLSAADLDVSVPIIGLDGRKPVFAFDPKDGLNGFQEFVVENGIDWRLFFETHDHPLSPTLLGKGRVQPAYKIDTSLVNPLGLLPEFTDPETGQPFGLPSSNNLAFRNLKRGVTLQLPSGQAVARLMGIAPIADERLLVGKANVDGLAINTGNASGVENRSIVDIDASFAGKAPLWFYVLAEALDQWRMLTDLQPDKDAKNAEHTQLGPVGGRLVGEVLIGLILSDNDSFLSLDPNWKPWFGDPQAANVFDRFTLGDLITAVSTI